MKYTIITYLRILFGPIIDHITNSFKCLALKIKNPTFHTHGSIKISNLKLGKYNFIGKNTRVSNTSLGDYSYISYDSDIFLTQIGKFSCIGPNVKIGLGNHPTKNFVSIHPLFYSNNKAFGISFTSINYFKEYEQTIIGNDVWIGSGCIIKSGIKIGNGAIIASGAVVTKDVIPYSIVGGVPGKLIKMRFTDQQIIAIEKSEWWNKEIDWFKDNFQLLHDISNFVKN